MNSHSYSFARHRQAPLKESLWFHKASLATPSSFLARGAILEELSSQSGFHPGQVLSSSRAVGIFAIKFSKLRVLWRDSGVILPILRRLDGRTYDRKKWLGEIFRFLDANCDSVPIRSVAEVILCSLDMMTAMTANDGLWNGKRFAKGSRNGGPFFRMRTMRVGRSWPSMNVRKSSAHADTYVGVFF